MDTFLISLSSLTRVTTLKKKSSGKYLTNFRDYFFNTFVKNGRYEFWSAAWVGNSRFNTNMFCESYFAVWKKKYLQGKKNDKVYSILESLSCCMSDIEEKISKREEAPERKAYESSREKIARRNHKKSMMMLEIIILVL